MKQIRCAGIAIFTGILLLLAAFTHKTPPVKEFFVDVKGARLFVRVVGKGEPMLLLHGGPGLNYSYFLPYMDELAGKYQLIYFDQRGCGQSADSVDEASITLQNYVDDIEQIRLKLKLEKMGVMGHSFGGLLAVHYALRHPDHLKKLILVNSVPLSKAYEKEANRLSQLSQTPGDTSDRNTILRSEAFANGEVGAYEKLFKILFRSSFYNPSMIEQLHLNLEKDFATHLRKVYNLSKDVQPDFDLYPELGKIKCPVLVIYGRQDAIPLQSSRDIQAACPQTVLKEMDQCGHFAFIEQKKAFMRAVKKF